jgi:hypothetical protein
VTVLEDEQPHEHVMKVRPARPGAAAVEFRFGSHDTFDVFVSAIRAEDVALSADLVAEILDAVEKGRVEDEVWERKGRVQKRRTILRLPSGDFHGREEVTLRGILGIGLGQRKVRPFAPYV